MATPHYQTCGLVVYRREHGDRTPRSGQVTEVYRKNPRHVGNHRLGICVWLVPYVCGMLMGIPALRLDSNVAFASAIGTSVVAGLLIFEAEAKRLRR